MIVLAFVGTVVLYFLGGSLVVGGLLNLAECGDRIGEKYRVSNYTQIVIGVLIIVGVYLL